MNIVLLKNLYVAHIAHIAVFLCLQILMNVKSPKNLEFIQTTRSSGGRARSTKPRRQVKKARKHHEARGPGHETRVWRHSTPVENVRQIDYFLCKTNPIFTCCSPKTMIVLKNKPNSKPIQTQNKPNFGPKTRINYENKPKQTQFKPKFTLEFIPECYLLGWQQGNWCLLAFLWGSNPELSRKSRIRWKNLALILKSGQYMTILLGFNTVYSQSFNL